MNGTLTSTHATDLVPPEHAGVFALLASMAADPPRCHKIELTISRDKGMQALKWLLVDEAQRLGLQCILFPDLEHNTTLVLVLPRGNP